MCYQRPQLHDLSHWPQGGGAEGGRGGRPAVVSFVPCGQQEGESKESEGKAEIEQNKWDKKRRRERERESDNQRLVGLMLG